MRATAEAPGRITRTVATVPGERPGSRTVVHATARDHQRSALPDEVQPIAGSIIDPHLADAFANGFNVAGIAFFKTPDASSDPQLGVGVAKAAEPTGKRSGLADLNHL